MDMLLDDSGEPLDDVVMIDAQDVDILPQSTAVIASIRSWLNPTQYTDDGSEYQKHRSSHLQGTGQWAIDSPIFQEWRESHDQGILWIRGIPGAGKSVHAANLIQHISQDGCPVLYFFFRHTIESNHRPEAALRDWLAQALPFSPPLQLELKERITEPVEKLTIPDLSQLVRLALARISQTYCIVDALDEMDQTALEPFLQMLDDLGHWRPAEIKFIITSRPVAIVERIVRNIQLLDVRLDKELVEPDIIVYLWHRLVQSWLLPESHSAVVAYILAKADGLFLYAKLAMDAISHLEDGIEVQQALHNLPTDLIDMYSNLLREHLQRTGIAPELHHLVLQCVTHAVRPLRLLEISDCITVTQPQHGRDPGMLKALVRSACGPLLEILPDETVRVVHHSLTEYLLGIIRPLNDITAPLALLESGQTHERIAMLCLMYLHLGGLEQAKVKTSVFQGEVTEKEIYTPFTNYALTNWHAHIKKAAAFGYDLKSVNGYLHQLLVEGYQDNTKKLLLFANVQSRGGRSSGRSPKPQAGALRLAIALGLHSFVESLLDRYGTDITNYDPDIDYSPLIFAVTTGNWDIVQSLISHGADVNEYDTHGATPLHTAVGWRFGRKSNAIMAEKLLKAGADPEKDIGKDQHVTDCSFGGRQKDPPCKYAFQGADKDTAAVFMPYVNGAQGASRALNWAVGDLSARDPGVIDEILRHPDLDINARHSVVGNFGMTPLFLACRVRDSSLIHKLLTAGADPNVPHISTGQNMPQISTGKNGPFGSIGHNGLFGSMTSAKADSSGHNVLHALANRGGNYLYGTLAEVSEEETRECFKLVIAAGADLQQTGPRKETPLHEARDKIAARCLIEAGADINAENDDGEAPIHVIFDGDILEALADFFDINTKSSKTEQTLLMRALDQSFSLTMHRGTKEQEFAKALKLIDLGADLALVDSRGKSAMHYAATMEDTELPKLKLLWRKLIDAGASPNLQDKDGETPLHKFGFTSRGFKSIEENLEAFLDITQPDTEIKDKKGRTPMFKLIDHWGRADASEISAVVKLLAKADACFDTTDSRGRTLLHAAARNCRNDTAHMKLLVDQGLDPNSQDADGNTIWHEAIPTFCHWRVSPSVFESFTALGVDLSKTNKDGRSPLHVLSGYTQWVDEGESWEKQDDPTILEYILGDKHVQVNLEDSQGITPLHIASTFSPFLVQRLLRAGANTVQTTTEGLNAFHLAARSRQSNAVGILISWLQSQGHRNSLISALNHKDIHGRTPLYYACASGRVESVQLLVDAGASVDSHSYMGSAWNGCADFEEEQRSAHWRRWDDNHGSYPPASAAGGVLVSDKRRPGQQHLDHFRFPVERIDKIVELIIQHGTSSANKFLDEAIKCTLEQQFDYTAMCLVRAREVLGITTALDCLEQVSECVKRREAVVSECVKRREAVVSECVKRREAVQSQSFKARGNLQYLCHLIRMMDFDTAGKLLLEDPDENLLNDKQHYGSNLIQLVESGFASLIDAVLTAEVISKLGMVPKPQQSITQTITQTTHYRNEDDIDEFDDGYSFGILFGDSLAAPETTVEISVDIRKGTKKVEPVKEKEAYIQADHKFAMLLQAACLTERPNMDVLRVLIEGKEISVNSAENNPHSILQPASSGTVLHALAKRGHPEWWQLHQALPFLLNKGADTEMRDSQGMTPLHLCLDKVGKPYFSKEVARMLLVAGADPNAVDNRDRSCLARAIGNREVCEMLLSHGARVSHSALAAAINSKDVDILQLLLSREGVDPNMRKVGKEVPGRSSANGRYFTTERHDPNDSDELYPIDYLLCDVSRNDTSDVCGRMFDLLLAHGANLGAKYERTTVVHRLLNRQGISMTTKYREENSFLPLVLKHPGLDIEVRDAEGSTVLLHACRIGKMKAINTLLDRGAKIRAKDIKNHNALHLLLSSGSSSWLESEQDRADRLVLRKGVLERMISLAPALLTERDAGGRTPLHCSLQHDPLIPNDVETLLDAGADVNAVITRTKGSPLHLLLGGAFHLGVDENGSRIVVGKRKHLLHRFITLGADINARNRAGETPAFHFFRKGSLEVTMPPSDTYEAFMKTFKQFDPHWYREMERKREQERERERERSAEAVEHEYRLWSVFEMSGLDWTATSKSRKTLLHIVATDVNKKYVGRRPARFRFLMGKGLDVLAEDDQHQTALDVAAALEVDDIFEIFKKTD